RNAWRAKRTDTARHAFLVWGGALLMTTAIFSFMAGIFHQYYTIALAPYIAALVGMGATMLWEERSKFGWSAVLGLTAMVTAIWSYVLLNRTPDYLPWLRWAVLLLGLAAGLALIFAGRLDRRLALSAAGVGLAASLAGPLAYTLSTVNSAHTGSIVTAGPSGASARGFGGGGGGGGGMGKMPTGGQGGQGGQGAQQGGGGGQMGQPPTGGGTGGGMGGTPPTGGQGPGNQNGTSKNGQQGGFPGGTGGRGEGGGGGGMGGLLDGASVSSAVKSKVSANADDYTWMAAAIGSQNAASYQLATGNPVMAIGGFNGSDPSPTLAQFKQYAQDGKIHYFISGGGMGGGGSSSGSASKITSWVEANYTKVTVGSTTLYDLTQPKS
ncbi:glycosyl transferase, partial [Streptomyces beijiangensis]|nr:glycosyl transferase [Streptomyces beijiangensis]